MILVVFGHLYGDYDNFLSYLIGSIHMPLFYFLSGYFFYYEASKYNTQVIISKKIKRLLFPYIIWSGISLIFNFFIHRTGSFLSIKAEFLDIFFYSRSVWFLIQLFITSMIFLLAIKIAQDNKWIMWITLLLLYVGLSYIIPYRIFAFSKFRWLFPFFSIGLVCGKYKEKLESQYIKKEHIYILLVMILLLVMFSFSYRHKWSVKGLYMTEEFNLISCGNSVFLLSGIVGIGAIMSLSKYLVNTLIGLHFAKYGGYTLDVYLLHMLFVTFIRTLIFKYFNQIIGAVVSFLIAIIIYEIIYFICRKWLRTVKIYNVISGNWR